MYVIKRIFTYLFLSMMIPFATLLVPLFRMMSQLKLINSYLAIILPSGATAFLIFFFRQSTKSFPLELVQAARIGGLSEMGIFFKIYIPTMMSTYAAAIIITFMAAWNNYMWPLVVLNNQKLKTLPILISSLGLDAYTPDYGIIMVAIVIGTLPTVILFFAM